MTDLDARVAAWTAIDPDPETRAEVAALIATGDADGVRDRFDARLEFGTAGLRGAIGAGPNRINRVVVMQTSAGLAAFLLERTANASVVIGYDARHNSARFARDAAEVLAAAGVAAAMLPRALPTPVLAFAVRDLGASAGVMITASHNPATDNGYKLYLGDADGGSQLVAPEDAAVLRHIEAQVATGALPPRSEEIDLLPESVVERYVHACAAVHIGDAGQPPPWVYTPMHGVGGATVLRVLAAAGIRAPVPVALQWQPDPDFPSVAFPNPEEDGALDAATAVAEEAGADLVVANDPDADRLAVAVREGGAFRRLTGNELGMVLAWHVATHARGGGWFATSIVSTPALAQVARHFGFGFTETLTGFKWISRVPALRFGFEEALGYLVDPGSVRDKDGISAAVALLDTAAELASSGRTLLDRLAEIEEHIGAFASAQISLRLERESIDATMAHLRTAAPGEIGGTAVRTVDDLAGGAFGLPPADVIRIHLDGGARVVVRPSGTEPKVKAYIDVTAPTRTEAASALDALTAGVRRLLTR